MNLTSNGPAKSSPVEKIWGNSNQPSPSGATKKIKIKRDYFLIHLANEQTQTTKRHVFCSVLSCFSHWWCLSHSRRGLAHPSALKFNPLLRPLTYINTQLPTELDLLQATATYHAHLHALLSFCRPDLFLFHTSFRRSQAAPVYFFLWIYFLP